MCVSGRSDDGLVTAQVWYVAEDYRLVFEKSQRKDHPVELEQEHPEQNR